MCARASKRAYLLRETVNDACVVFVVQQDVVAHSYDGVFHICRLWVHGIVEILPVQRRIEEHRLIRLRGWRHKSDCVEGHAGYVLT